MLGVGHTLCEFNFKYQVREPTVQLESSVLMDVSIIKSSISTRPTAAFL